MDITIPVDVVMPKERDAVVTRLSVDIDKSMNKEVVITIDVSIGNIAITVNRRDLENVLHVLDLIENG